MGAVADRLVRGAKFTTIQASELESVFSAGAAAGLAITSPSYAFPGVGIGGQFLGLSQSTITTRAWVSGDVAVLNEFITQVISTVPYVYQVTTAGTFTTVAPSHTTGQAVNGTATLTQIPTLSIGTNTAVAYVGSMNIGAGPTASTSQGAFLRLYGFANTSSQSGGDFFLKTGGNFGFRNDTSRFATFNSTTGSLQLENIAGTIGDFICAKIGGSLSIAQGSVGGGGFKGDVTLAAGVGTITGMTNIAVSHGVFLGNLVTGGTGGARYKIAITAGTGFTVTAVDAAGATVTTDTSSFKFVVIK